MREEKLKGEGRGEQGGDEQMELVKWKK